MCAIGGYYAPDNPIFPGQVLGDLVRAGTERGRDSWGVATSTGQWRGGPGLPPANLGAQLSTLERARWAMVNNRAEPTTERQAHKGPENIQPFIQHRVTVAHNGTIANDKALIERFGLLPRSTVDSAVLPGLFARMYGLTLATRVRAGLEVVVGSYAMSVGYGDELVLACNYRPLYLRRLLDAWVFSSQESYLPGLAVRHPTVAVPPYSIVSFGPFEPLIRPLRTPKAGPVLVVCSGGLDSTVAATQRVREGRDVTLLHVTYGCRAEVREVQAVADVAQALGVEVMTVDMRELFATIGGSPLTNTKATFAPGEAGAEFAHEWVPARNLIMLAVATGIAEAHGFSELVLGNNIEEAGAYPDNEQQFIALLNDVLPYAVADGKHVSITMPVGTLVKHEIVELGHFLGAPIAQSWSCYNDGAVHCGRCGPCYMRHHAHVMNGLEDPTKYEVVPE